MRRQLGRGGYLLLYLAALGISGWFLVARLERAVGDVQAERAADVETVRTELSLSMVAAQSYVELLQKTVQNEFAVRPSAAPGSVLLNALKVDQDGVFSLDALPPSIDTSTVGNLTGFGGLKGRGDYFQRELEIALSLRSAFNQIVVNLPSVAWVYYVSGNRFEHVYPWVPSTQAAYKDNDLQMEYFLRGLPENNPKRAPYLTDIYDDDFGKGLMITLGRPTYDGDRFTGIVALDFTLRTLDGIVGKFPASSGALYLVDMKKNVIGFSGQREANKPASLPDDAELLSLLDRSIETSSRLVSETPRELLSAQVIRGFPFALVATAPKSEIYRQAMARSIFEFAIFLTVISLLAFLEWRRRVAGRIRVQRNDLRNANAKLEEARVQAEDATRAKSTFLAMMSHEIRTPMNGVMSMAEMLDQTDLSDDQRSMSSVIRSSASALLTIINDILDFSKIEAGKLAVESTPFALVDLVEDSIELLSHRAEDKAITLATVIDSRIPAQVSGDSTRVRQILLNLVGNALKFTDRGSVTVRVTSMPEAPAAQLTVRFAISDTGIGLTEDQQGRLFQAFAQADASTARKYGGTGLGLSISRRLCELMGGRIGVHSKFGEGATFWFELPFEVIAAPAPAVANIDDARVALIGFRDATRESLGEILSAYAISGAAAHPFGIEAGAVAQMRQGANRPPPVVFISAEDNAVGSLALGKAVTDASRGEVRLVLAAPRSLASTLSEAERGAFFATVTLPLRRHRVAQVIAAALGRGSLSERSGGAEAGTSYAPPDAAEARSAGVMILVAEDNPTNQVVITRLLAQRGYASEIAKDGVEALRMYESRGGYGLLLTDFHMPEMDGITLTATIRGREAAGAKRLPIVALTADALSDTAQRCKDADIDGYLTKPIDSKLLTETLEKWLPGAAPLRRPAARAGKRAAAPTIDPQIFDVGRLEEIYGSITPEARAFLGKFLVRAREIVTAVHAAMAANDPPEARDQVHSLKGSAGSIGAVRLGRVAGDVQDCLDGGDLDTAQLFVAGLDSTVEELRREVQSLLDNP